MAGERVDVRYPAKVQVCQVADGDGEAIMLVLSATLTDPNPERYRIDPDLAGLLADQLAHFALVAKTKKLKRLQPPEA